MEPPPIPLACMLKQVWRDTPARFLLVVLDMSDNGFYLKSIKLAQPLPERGLEKGQSGTIVEVLADGEAFEVEFVEPGTGRTIAVLTLTPDQFEINEPESPHRH